MESEINAAKCGTYVIKRQRPAIVGEVDGLEIDEVEIAAETGVRAVRDAVLLVQEFHRVDVVIVRVVDLNQK